MSAGRVFHPAAPAFAVVDERPDHASDRETLLDIAMGKDRFSKSSELLRAGRHPASGMALVAVTDGRVVGTVRLWEVETDTHAMLLLGPLAVDPRTQGAGVGKALVSESLRRASLFGHEAVVLVGDPGYYGRFGFASRPAAGLSMPGRYEQHRLQALELRPGALKGACGLIRARRLPLPAAA